MNNNADNKPGVMIYFDIIPLIEEMNPENAGQLFLAILKYAQYGEVPSLSGLARSVWPFIKSLVDRDSRRYDIARKKKQWATYCRDAKRRGEEHLDFDLWLLPQWISDLKPKKMVVPPFRALSMVLPVCCHLCSRHIHSLEVPHLQRSTATGITTALPRTGA